jgi:hypothetical protein
MANERLTRDEQRERLHVKARDLDHKVAQTAVTDDAVLDAMVRKSIKDHGA